MFDTIYTEKYLDDLIEATYEISPVVFFKYTWKPQWNFTLDDYKQEAAMEIVRLFKERFITPPQDNYTKTNLKTYVYSILNKYFTINIINTFKYREHVNLVEFDSPDSVLKNNIASDVISPVRYSYIEAGKELLEDVIDQLSPHPFTTKIHSYINKQGEELSEVLLAKLIIEGYEPTEVVNMFTDENIGYYGSQPAFIRNKYKTTLDKLVEKINEYKPATKQLLLEYLMQGSK